jgi:signal peptidase II
LKRALIVTLLVLVADQSLKIWVKTHFFLGEYVPLFGAHSHSGYLQFVENDGMAFGLRIGGNTGKLLLTLFRIAAVGVIGWILWHMVQRKRGAWMITSLALILAGALGNIIDSALYGLIFDKGTVFDPGLDRATGYEGVAQLSTAGYTSFLHGSVVDMFYFPLWQGRFPDWLPIWGGEYFEFFRPVFNIADAAISVGVAMMILARRRHSPEQVQAGPSITTVGDNAPPHDRDVNPVEAQASAEGRDTNSLRDTSNSAI